MAWVVLILSAVLEAVWATALGVSDGLSRPGPTIVFLLATTLSMVGLAWAMKQIPLSVAYSVWVGLGAGLTVAYAMVAGTESVSGPKILLLLGLIGSVVGLKFVKSESGGRAADSPKQAVAPTRRRSAARSPTLPSRRGKGR